MTTSDKVCLPHASQREVLTAGTLAVVATPLGHLGDITERCRQVLAQADTVLAEDTRRTRILLSHLGLSRPLTSLHAHNEQGRRHSLIERLLGGERLALVSDAGTPAISDPGALLVQAAHAAGVPVCPIPGPSALTAALSVSGFFLGPQGALFLGFLPRAQSERRRALARAVAHPGPAVLFESPERLAATLAALAEAAPEREACLCRELTKMHEQVLRAQLVELAARTRSIVPRGECTVVLGPISAEDRALDDEANTLSDTALLAHAGQLLHAGLTARDAASALQILLCVPHRRAYQQVQQAKAAQDSSAS